MEDIVDTGFTARYLLQTLAGRGPNSIALCTMLDRTPRRIVPLQVDFCCFEIPDRFVIGCGLDYKQLYRNLDFIAVMKPGQSVTGRRPAARGILSKRGLRFVQAANASSFRSDLFLLGGNDCYHET